MKNFNYNKFAIRVAFISLILGFVANYFSEPSREEKVMKALNYDLRFTEKVIVKTDEPKRKPTSSEEESENRPTDFGKLTTAMTDKAYLIYQRFVAKKDLVHLQSEWFLTKNFYAIKGGNGEDKKMAIESIHGYYIYSEQQLKNLSLKGKTILKLALNKRTKNIGFATGMIVVILNEVESKQDILTDYQLEEYQFFMGSKVLISKPLIPDEYEIIVDRLKADTRIKSAEHEIISRFVSAK